MRTMNDVLHDGCDTVTRHMQCAFKRASGVVFSVRMTLDDKMPGKILIDANTTSALHSSALLPYVLLWNDIVEYLAYPWGRLLWNADNHIWLGLTAMFWACCFSCWCMILSGPLWVWVCATLYWLGCVLIFSDLALRTEEFGTVYGALLSYIPGAVEYCNTRLPEDQTIHEVLVEQMRRADFSFHAQRLMLLTTQQFDWSRDEVQQILTGCDPRLVALLTGSLEDLRARWVPQILPPRPQAAAMALKHVREKAQLPRAISIPRLGGGPPTSVPTPTHPTATYARNACAAAASSSDNGNMSSSNTRKRISTISTSSTSTPCSDLVSPQHESTPTTTSSSSHPGTPAKVALVIPCASPDDSTTTHGNGNGHSLALDAYGRPRLVPLLQSLVRTRIAHALSARNLTQFVWAIVVRSDLCACAGLGLAMLLKRSRTRALRFLTTLVLVLVRRSRMPMLR